MDRTHEYDGTVTPTSMLCYLKLHQSRLEGDAPSGLQVSQHVGEGYAANASVLQPQELNSANNWHELGKGPQASGKMQPS